MCGATENKIILDEELVLVDISPLGGDPSGYPHLLAYFILTCSSGHVF